MIPLDKVKSSPQSIDEKEIVLSVKTTSKDRMGSAFLTLYGDYANVKSMKLLSRCFKYFMVS